MGKKKSANPNANLKAIADYYRNGVTKNGGAPKTATDLEILRAYCTCDDCGACPTDEEIMQAVDTSESDPDYFWDLILEHEAHEPDCADYV